MLEKDLDDDESFSINVDSIVAIEATCQIKACSSILRLGRRVPDANGNGNGNGNGDNNAAQYRPMTSYEQRANGVGRSIYI